MPLLRKLCFFVNFLLNSPLFCRFPPQWWKTTKGALLLQRTPWRQVNPNTSTWSYILSATPSLTVLLLCNGVPQMTCLQTSLPSFHYLVITTLVLHPEWCQAVFQYLGQWFKTSWYLNRGSVEGTGSLNLDLDSQISRSLFHYTPWALHSDLVR